MHRLPLFLSNHLYNKTAPDIPGAVFDVSLLSLCQKRRLHFDNDWEHHRTALGLGKEELSDILAELVLHIFPIELHARSGILLDNILNLALRLVHEIKILFHVDEAARRDLDIAEYFL